MPATSNSASYQKGYNRPVIGSVALSVVAALYLLVVANKTFWTKTVTYMADPWSVVLLALGLAGLFCALLVTFSVKYFTKPFLIFLVISAAAASWFMDVYGVIIDKEMVRNAMETTTSEAGHLVTWGFLRHMALFALLPTLLILWVKIEHRTFGRKVKGNLPVILLCLAVTAVTGFAGVKTFATTSRAHHDLLATLNPFSPIVQVTRYIAGNSVHGPIVVQPRGMDAKVVTPAGTSSKPRVTIIVAGETARGESFALNGYNRDTNPELSKQDISYFSDTSSCGTATAVSIPCMFSVYGRSGYSHDKGLSTENLVDVLSHAGIRTEWWDNNTGDKGVADRIPNRSLSNENDPRFCVDNECHDEVILSGLDGWLDTVKGDSVLVVHQLGSHGPAYSQRYTEEFRRFTPDCQTAELGNCSQDEIVNAYDNTILYTDHILSEIINKLKMREDKLSGQMIYMSDHGESLGEKGLYLHGAPYIIAPSQQTHIPFVLWLGKDAKRAVDPACVATKTTEPQSHDNLFSTVLGMMSVKTTEYKPDLDVLASCRKNVTS
jgi:lipid A ethanolaminephosphotransferase